MLSLCYSLNMSNAHSNKGNDMSNADDIANANNCTIENHGDTFTMSGPRFDMMDAKYEMVEAGYAMVPVKASRNPAPFGHFTANTSREFFANN